MSYSSDNSFEKIMNRMLSNEILANVDKRVGSIIYDALAPCAMELAEVYMKLDVFENQAYLLTATGENLDRRVYDYGIVRKPATKSLRVGEFKKYQIDENGEKTLIDMDIDIGSRFVIPEGNITYIYTGVVSGYKILECEQEGSKGDEYIGTILPLTPIKDLIEANLIDSYQLGEDVETDDELRVRTQRSIMNVAFGGNVFDYIEKTNSIDGVGNTKVFPAWKQNGTVLLSVVDSTYDPVNDLFLQNVKQQIDPEDVSGEGVGIAPIGHFVTVTTPTKQNVKIKATLILENDVVLSEVDEEIKDYLEEYFYSVRKEFGQGKNLSVYKARIIEAILRCNKILNVTNVLLNDVDSDILYTDEPKLNKQFLPYISEVQLIE